jgi:hypothetical protein
MMAVYDLHDEMNPARLIGPEPPEPPGCESDSPSVVDHAIDRLALLEPEVDQELDPLLWRDVCDPRTPPAPVATGLEAVGLAAHGMEPGPPGRADQLDQVALAEAPTVDLGGSPRLRVILCLAGAVVALLLLPVVLVFVV